MRRRDLLRGAVAGLLGATMPRGFFGERHWDADEEPAMGINIITPEPWPWDQLMTQAIVEYQRRLQEVFALTPQDLERNPLRACFTLVSSQYVDGPPRSR